MLCLRIFIGAQLVPSSAHPKMMLAVGKDQHANAPPSPSPPYARSRSHRIALHRISVPAHHVQPLSNKRMRGLRL